MDIELDIQGSFTMKVYLYLPNDIEEERLLSN